MFPIRRSPFLGVDRPVRALLLVLINRSSFNNWPTGWCGILCPTYILYGNPVFPFTGQHVGYTRTQSYRAIHLGCGCLVPANAAAAYGASAMLRSSSKFTCGVGAVVFTGRLVAIVRTSSSVQQAVWRFMLIIKTQRDGQLRRLKSRASSLILLRARGHTYTRQPVHGAVVLQPPVIFRNNGQAKGIVLAASAKF